MSSPHYLKTLAPAFDAILSGKKTFEVRKNDRLFQPGDQLILVRTSGHHKEDEQTIHDAQNGKYVSKLTCKVGWILGGGQFGIEPGYVAFSLEDMGQ